MYFNILLLFNINIVNFNIITDNYFCWICYVWTLFKQ